MTRHESPTSASRGLRKKLRVAFWFSLLAVGLLVLGNLPFSRFSTSRTFTEAETVFVEPLIVDGRVNYAFHINRMNGQDVQPEQNLAVELFRLADQKAYKRCYRDYRKDLGPLLGLQPIPPITDRQQLFELVKQDLVGTTKDVLIIDERLQEFERQKSEVLRLGTRKVSMDIWIAALRQRSDTLDQVRQACLSSRYYHPITSSEYQILHFAQTPLSDFAVVLAEELLVDAFFRYQRLGRVVENAKAIRRLSCLLAQSKSSPDWTNAFACYNFAKTLETEILLHNKLDRETLVDYRQFLARHPFPQNFHVLANHYERYVALDNLQYMHWHGSSEMELGSEVHGPYTHPSMMHNALVDYSDLGAGMELINSKFETYTAFFDGTVTADSFEESTLFYYVLEEEMLSLNKVNVTNVWNCVFGEKRRGKEIGTIVAPSGIFRLEAMKIQLYLTLSYDRQSRVAFAAKLYQFDTGDLPQQLTELVPEYLDAVEDLEGNDFQIALVKNLWVIEPSKRDVDIGFKKYVGDRKLGSYPIQLDWENSKEIELVSGKNESF